MENFLLLMLLLAVVVVAAYFYLKRRQQHIHLSESSGTTVEHRHEKSPTEPIADHGHDLDTPETTTRDR